MDEAPTEPMEIEDVDLENEEAEPVEEDLLPPGVFAILTLDKPIKAHGEEITRIELREPDIGTLDGIKTGGKNGFNLGYIAIIIARLGDIPPSAAKKIPLRKLLSVKRQIESFFDVSL